MEGTIVAKWSGEVGGEDRDGGRLAQALRGARRTADYLALKLLDEHEDWLGAHIKMWVTIPGIGFEGAWRLQERLGCEEFRTIVRHVPWDDFMSSDAPDVSSPAVMDALWAVVGEMEADDE